MVTVLVAVTAGACPAVAETHPFLFSFGSFTNPNGIAVASPERCATADSCRAAATSVTPNSSCGDAVERTRLS